MLYEVITQFILVYNLAHSWFYGKKAKRNPWRANTLEWQAPSPPPHGNFDTELRVYRGPYEYSSPESVQDYLPQTVSPEELLARITSYNVCYTKLLRDLGSLPQDVEEILKQVVDEVAA